LEQFGGTLSALAGAAVVVGAVASERNFASYFASLRFASDLEFEVYFRLSVVRPYPSRNPNPVLHRS